MTAPRDRDLGWFLAAFGFWFVVVARIIPELVLAALLWLARPFRRPPRTPGRHCRCDDATPMIPGTVPPPVPDAPAAPLAGAEAPAPAPPSAGAGASPRRDTWVIHHEPPGSVIVGPGGAVFAHRAWIRTPTMPNPALGGPGTVPLRAVDVALVRPYVIGSAAWWIGTGILGAS